MKNLVTTTKPYNYNLLNKNIISLKRTYPFINIETIGHSVLGNNLYIIKLGNGPKKVFYSASIHANEYITSIVLMKFVEEYCKSYIKNQKLLNTSIRKLFNSTTIYIMPMINPDGVNLVTNFYKTDSFQYRKAKEISNKYPDIDFPIGWKSNINGIDLNLQFPSGWQNAKKIKFNKGISSPSPRDFVGYNFLTEPESIALYNYTLIQNFDLTISLHSQGKEIYWNYQNFSSNISYSLGLQFANNSGYKLTSAPYNSSFAGYKDWFIDYFHKPGFTIECGLGSNPLPLSQVEEIYNDILCILLISAT